jgi:hypothetical protein
MNRRWITILIGGVLLCVAILWIFLASLERMESARKVSLEGEQVDSTKAAGESAERDSGDSATARDRKGTNVGTTSRESAELAALKSALLEPLEDERRRKFLEALSAMKAGDAPAVAELLLQLKKLGRELPIESEAFWRRWGELDSKAAIAALTLDPGLQRLVGQTVTLRGRFELAGKVGPYIDRSGRPVYLVPHGSFSWGSAYEQMQGKVVSITGTLRFRQFEHVATDGASAQAFDYFYFDAETARIKIE